MGKIKQQYRKEKLRIFTKCSEQNGLKRKKTNIVSYRATESAALLCRCAGVVITSGGGGGWVGAWRVVTGRVMRMKEAS